MEAPSQQASVKSQKQEKDASSSAPSSDGAGSFCIAPRNRTKDGAKKSNAPVQFTPEIIRALASKPIKQAAETVGVSVTALKRACRELGFEKWPRECVEINISYDAIKREKPISRTSSSSPKSSPPTDASPSPAPEASNQPDVAKPLPKPVEPSCSGTTAQAPLPPMQTPAHPVPEAGDKNPSCSGTKTPVLPPLKTTPAHVPLEGNDVPSVPGIREMPCSERPSHNIPPMEVPNEKPSCCSVLRTEVLACCAPATAVPCSGSAALVAAVAIPVTVPVVSVSSRTEKSQPESALDDALKALAANPAPAIEAKPCCEPCCGPGETCDANGNPC